jgi:hypothetical protein
MGRNHALFSLLILLGPLVVGLPMALLVAGAFFYPIGFGWLTLGLYSLGLALFLSAKLSLLRRGILISLGSSRMSTCNRRAYRAGYTLMALAILATFPLLKAVMLS